VDTGPEDRADEFHAIAELAEAFTALVEVLTEQRTVDLSVEALVSFGQQTMPRAQHTGLVLHERGSEHTVAASSDTPERLDRMRAELGEGPALDVLETNDMVISGDLGSDPRWPVFGPRALEELDVRSIACYRLHLGRDHRAALSFLSDWPFAFDEVAVGIGAIVASYCSLVLASERVLGDRVGSRAVEVHREIGVAVGILLSDGALTVDEGYRRLHHASRTLTRSLPEVAQHVIAHHALPEA
jgi:ANTAR domain-containing protein